MNLEQKITSANTSQHQIPALYKKCKFKKGSFILDYGCGKYFKDIKDYIELTYGCLAIGYDPYNRTKDQNKKSLYLVEQLRNRNMLSYITCANVLNVIQEESTILDLLNDIYDLSNNDTIIIFSVYYGDGTGRGRITKDDCWQNNQKTDFYLPYIEQLFNIIQIKGNIIISNKKERNLEIAI